MTLIFIRYQTDIIFISRYVPDTDTRSEETLNETLALIIICVKNEEELILLLE